MWRSPEGTTVVLLPGTGSDARFLLDAFGAPVAAAGARLVAVEPDPTDLVGGYVAELDRAADAGGQLVVGGVSVGAAVALRWSLSATSVLGVMAVMPAWTGSPRGSVAAASARLGAGELRRVGLDRTVAAMQASSPAWLAGALTRSWRGQWPALPDAMEEAASYRGPTARHLATVRCPVGIAAAMDDPIHPLAVAEDWHRAIPRSALTSFPLSALGDDLTTLGRRALDALAEATAPMPRGGSG